MKPKKDTPFSWPLLFLVTAASFFIFGMIMKFLDGSSVHISLFFKIGIVSAGLSLISFFSRQLNESATED